MKEVRIEMETELEHQKDLTAAIEQQIVQKQSLVSKEEYIKKCLEHLSMHQRELMPPGVVSSLVGSYFGAEYRVQSMIEETHLASKYIKTQTAILTREAKNSGECNRLPARTYTNPTSALRPRKQFEGTLYCQDNQSSC